MEGQNDNPSILQKMAAADTAALGGIDDILNGGTAQPTQPAPTQPVQPTPTQPTQPAPTQPAQPTEPPKPPEPAKLHVEPVTAAGMKGMFEDPSVTPTDDKPAGLPPDEEVPPPAEMDEKAGNAWAALRQQKNELRHIAEEQNKRILAFAEKEAKFEAERKQLTDALHAKEAELKEKTDRLGKLDLTQSVEFRKRYDEPVALAEASLDASIQKLIVADTPEAVAAARNAILSDDAAFRDYVAELPPEAQNELQVRRQALLDQEAARQQAIDNWVATSGGLSSIAAEENAAERSLRRSKAAEDAIAFSTQRMPADRRAMVLNDAYFADDVKAATDAFKDFMQVATDEQIARSAYLGHLVPVMNRALATAISELKEFRDAYYAVKGLAKPGTFAVGAPPPRVAPTPPAPAQPKLTPAQQADAEATDLVGRILAGG